MRKRRAYSHEEQQAYREGHTAAEHDAARICPNYPTFDERNAWRRGFDDERFAKVHGYDVAFAPFFEKNASAL